MVDNSENVIIKDNRFQWNKIKAAKNIKDHNVSFAEAATVFSDPDYVLQENKTEADELRFVAIGYSTKQRILFVVHCERENNIIRIISAREASRTQREEYYAKY
jgi:uncharacterized DUF497 family protein